ncbi:hypothetical protein [Raoultella terrigena]|uniref:hypothetical protein n=1 Tax=Raoultella terrigena TaxID=577 RepID=UPI001911096C|nr:hypothetical protein [Raoultella terrigena]
MVVILSGRKTFDGHCSNDKKSAHSSLNTGINRCGEVWAPLSSLNPPFVGSDSGFYCDREGYKARTVPSLYFYVHSNGIGSQAERLAPKSGNGMDICPDLVRLREAAIVV